MVILLPPVFLITMSPVLYFINKIEYFTDRFNEYRNNNLQKYLYDIPNINNNLEKTKITFEKLKLLKYDIYFLDILPSKSYINKTNNFIKEKYDFISQKLNILQIYTKNEFEKNYNKKVIQYYFYMLNLDNKIHDHCWAYPKGHDSCGAYPKGHVPHVDIIKNKIIDTLYDYIIKNNI